MRKQSGTQFLLSLSLLFSLAVPLTVASHDAAGREWTGYAKNSTWRRAARIDTGSRLKSTDGWRANNRGQRQRLTLAGSPSFGSPGAALAAQPLLTDTHAPVASVAEDNLVAWRSTAEPESSESLVGESASGYHNGRPIIRQLRVSRGTVRTSLTAAAEKVGVPQEVLVEFVRTFSNKVDLRRDLGRGDRFEVMYEQIVDDFGNTLGFGPMLYGAVVIGGERVPIYRFVRRDGLVDHYDQYGRSVRAARLAAPPVTPPRKAIPAALPRAVAGSLRTPLDAGSLTSGYGYRIHPILGYSRMHRGVDLAAPHGTPVYAVADGVVQEAKWQGGYGKLIVIAHDSRLATAYGHLSQFSSGIEPGIPVARGDVIGFVGSTGRSTGPHLHFEVRIDGQQVDPTPMIPIDTNPSGSGIITVSLPASRPAFQLGTANVSRAALEGDEMNRFRSFVDRTNYQYGRLTTPLR
jgi:murein DD-endopeptidase MepM/ murein hydrolase activator NlpD